jgi:hypothetical protein
MAPRARPTATGIFACALASTRAGTVRCSRTPARIIRARMAARAVSPAREAPSRALVHRATRDPTVRYVIMVCLPELEKGHSLGSVHFKC